MNKSCRHSVGKLLKWQSVLSSNEHRDELMGYLFIRKLNKQSLKSKTTDESMQIIRQTGAKQNQINSLFDEWMMKRGEKQWHFDFCEISGLNEEFWFDPKLLNWCRNSISIFNNHKSILKISIIFLQKNLWEKLFHVRLANQQVFIEYDHWKLSDSEIWHEAWANVIC